MVPTIIANSCRIQCAAEITSLGLSAYPGSNTLETNVRFAFASPAETPFDDCTDDEDVGADRDDDDDVISVLLEAPYLLPPPLPPFDDDLPLDFVGIIKRVSKRSCENRVGCLNNCCC